MIYNDDVQIIFCNDDQGNHIHYSQVEKGNKYFCIDCEKELIVKDGDIKIKHLAHKNTENCGGTGESIIHKHWKENLFKAGMFINVKGESLEILKVINEVPLSQRYNKEWDREIIVDALLVTNNGDIVIEINYKNPKNWEQLFPYYDELDLLDVFEVTVDRHVNTPLKWLNIEHFKALKMKKEFEAKEKERKANERKQEERERERLRQLLKDAKSLIVDYNSWDKGDAKKLLVFFNYKNKLVKMNANEYYMECLCKIGKSKYQNVLLLFNPGLSGNKNMFKNFKTSNGIRKAFIVVDDKVNINGAYRVLQCAESQEHEYDKWLYKELCNVTSKEQLEAIDLGLGMVFPTRVKIYNSAK